MKLTYKYRLYRSKRNSELHETISLAGRAYNHCIALHQRYYKLSGKHLNAYALMKHLAKLKRVPRFEWLKRIPSQALQEIPERIDKAYKLFFKSAKGEIGIKVAPPSFKKVRKYKSFTLKQAGWKLLEANKLKVGSYVYKLCQDRPIPADAQIKTVTIKRDVLGNLYACFSLVVPDPKPAPTSGKVAGFDFGLNMFLTRHDGQQIPSPEFFKVGMNEIAKLNRSLSRKVKGSNHWHKAKRALAKAHMAIVNKRRDWFFKLAHRLTDEYDVLCFEDLNLRGMVRLWGRKVSDLAFATFVTILQFVAQKKGKPEAGCFRPSLLPISKTCTTVATSRKSWN